MTVALVLTLGIFIFAYPAALTGWVIALQDSFIQHRIDPELLTPYIEEAETAGLTSSATPPTSLESPLASTTERTDSTEQPSVLTDTLADPAGPSGLITFEGATDSELARHSRDILERVWNGEGVDKGLSVTYTGTPIYDPERDTLNLIGWDESQRGSTTIVIPSSPNELTPGVVYASTFMVLVLQLAENPDAAPLEELQGIYTYATQAEYEEVLRCFEELKLTYCTIFIASYSSVESSDLAVTLPKEPAPSPGGGTKVGTPESPSAALSESPSNLEELREYMLGLINTDRQAHGVAPVALGDNTAAQAHAEEMLLNGYLSHWGMDGLTPYMRYTIAGGVNNEGENASAPVGLLEGVNYRRRTATRSLEETQEGFMNSPGHRKNILDKWHKKVNLGIACNQSTCAVSQQFEGDYVVFVVFNETPIIIKGELSFSGELKGPFAFDGVQIWYDQPPHPLTLGQLDATYAYLKGQQPATFLNKPLSGGAYYPSDVSTFLWQSSLDPYSLDPNTPRGRASPVTTTTKSKVVPWTTANVWRDSGQSFQLEADISAVVNDLGPGIYTVVIWGKAGGESVALTNFSIFVVG